MVDRIKIGNFLRELRNEKGLTQEELAEKFDVSSRSVSRWENGNTMPELGILMELADFYGVDIKEIIDGERKSEIMNKEEKHTLTRVADYARSEKMIAVKEKSVITFVLTLCALCIVVGMVYLARTKAIVKVPDQEVTVKAVYRYETGEGYNFFVLAETPTYFGEMTTTCDAEDDNTLVINQKKALWTKVFEQMPTSLNLYNFNCGKESNDNGGYTLCEYDTLRFGNQVIWSKDKNINDKIPAYVEVYNQFETGGSEIVGWTTEDDYMAAQYADGTIVKWDYDGNIIE